MTMPVVLEPNEDGTITAECPFLPGCISQGDTREEALAHIREAMELYLHAVRREIALQSSDGSVEELAIDA